MPKLLFIDTETGGLKHDTHALLSIGLVVWNSGTILSRDEFFVQPEGRVVEPKALEINGINMDDHMKVAYSRAEAAQKLEDWIKCAWNGSGKGWDKPILAGHNVPFDFGFLGELYPPGVFREMISHRFVDTLMLLTAFEHAKIIPPWNGRLEKACAYFKIPFEASEKHTALGDIVATARLYTHMLTLMAPVPEVASPPRRRF